MSMMGTDKARILGEIDDLVIREEMKFIYRIPSLRSLAIYKNINTFSRGRTDRRIDGRRSQKDDDVFRLFQIGCERAAVATSTSKLNSE